MKQIDTLVQDIYSVVATKEVPDDVSLEAEIEQFGENCKRLMRNLFTEKRDGRKLRMSNIGRGDRFLWNVVNNPDVTEELTPNTHLKFMFGHLTEELLLFLTKAAGHRVTDEQKRCEVSGVVGHMDCKIDDVVTDVKSASPYGFKKFKDRSLAFDDPFGYVSQIKGYAHSEGETKYGWLAFDKSGGHLTYLLYDETDTTKPEYDLISYDMEEYIERVKKIVGSPQPPSVCYEPVDDGKSGNQKLAAGCSYCTYKLECWPSVRAFAYSSGPRYLVTIENEPKVYEIPLRDITDF